MQIIAESGGTKTDWRFLYEDGRIEQFVSTGLNPTYATQSALSELLNTELTIKINEPIESIHFYGAGCQHESAKNKLKDVLSDYFTNCDHININHDLLAAARACSKDEEGIICILGTGSNACYYDGKSITKQMTNLGFIIGDEGSGAYIGKQLLKDYFEKRLPEDLNEKFKGAHPKLSRESLIEQLYRKEKPNKFLAQFFPFVLEHQSTPYCQRLMVDAFEAFLKNVQHTFGEKTKLPIHFVGGVAFHANPILRRVLQKMQLNTGRIIESAIAGLTLYHQKNS